VALFDADRPAARGTYCRRQVTTRFATPTSIGTNGRRPATAAGKDHSLEESKAVKRKVAFAALTALALVVAAYTGSRLLAQSTPGTAARPAAAGTGTRVALINLRFVIKNYKKYLAFMDEMKHEDTKYVTLIQNKQKEKENLQKNGATMPEGPAREKIENDIKRIQREMEDLAAKARKEMARRGNEEMVKVYKEIRDAAYRHATSNNIDLVLHFEGPADAKEIDSPLLIQKNFNAGGCCPMYWNGALDISGPVLQALNTAFTNNAAKAAKPAATPAAPR
jgi:Skp family chaperone for outer membrane proteins